MILSTSDFPLKDATARSGTVPFQFHLLEEHRFALDRLDLTFRFGCYGIRMLHCHLASFTPGQTIGFHKHSDYEFHFIPRGKGKVILADVEYPLHEGLFYLTGPGVVHYQEADEHDPMNELCLHVDIQEIHQAATEHEADDEWNARLEIQEASQCVRQLNELPAVPIVDRYNAMQWFLTAYRAWYENRLGAYTTIKYAITQIMLRAVQNYFHHQGPFDIPQRDMNAYRYQLATQFIQDNYASPLTLDDVASRLHISGRQLQRILEQGEAGSFKNYLENVRLSHICQAIKEGERNVEQIAEEHGFSSSNYLYAVFKRKLGLTPGQYRRQHNPSVR